MAGSWCERGDLNPYPLRDWILSPARLPIPPLSPGAQLRDLYPKTVRFNGVGNSDKFQLQQATRNFYSIFAVFVSISRQMGRPACPKDGSTDDDSSNAPG